MQEQPQKQPHEIVLERLSAFRWGGLYVHINRCHSSGAVFDIILHYPASVWTVNGVKVEDGKPIPGISTSELDFIRRAKALLASHNVRVRIKELGGMFGLRALTDGFAEALEFFEAATFHGYGSDGWIPEPAKTASAKRSQLDHRIFV